MKLNDYDDQNNKEGLFTKALVVSIVAIVVVLIIVLSLNFGKLKKRFSEEQVSASDNDIMALDETDKEPLEVSLSSEVHVSDLDFYDFFSEENNEDEEDEEALNVTESVEEENLTEENDGKHTLVTYEDFSTEWVPISQYITKSDYDYTNLYNQSGKMKYYEDNKCTSFFGVDISKDQDYVDFNKLKKAGVDFVMLRAGQRGYQSGQISEDDYFKDNLKRANDAGLLIGIYFYSQAVTKDEALEEVNKIVEWTNGYSIDYPVVYVNQAGNKDSKRVDALSKNDRTMVARYFLNACKDSGFIPVLSGNKKFLIKDIDLSKIMGDYDVWLLQPDIDLPDYPYKFTMWQYSTNGTIDGISGYVSFDISFVDYSLK